jgi:hypothetical protein
LVLVSAYIRHPHLLGRTFAIEPHQQHPTPPRGCAGVVARLHPVPRCTVNASSLWLEAPTGSAARVICHRRVAVVVGSTWELWPALTPRDHIIAIAVGVARHTRWGARSESLPSGGTGNCYPRRGVIGGARPTPLPLPPRPRHTRGIACGLLLALAERLLAAASS